MNALDEYLRLESAMLTAPSEAEADRICDAMDVAWVALDDAQIAMLNADSRTVTLDATAWAKFVEIYESPPAPTAALIALMKGEVTRLALAIGRVVVTVGCVVAVCRWLWITRHLGL